MVADVLILGAGFAGLELATLLSETLVPDVRVTLVDRSDTFVFGFSKLEVLTGLSADEVRLPYSEFRKDGVEFRRESVTSIDPASRRVVTDGRTYEPDVLVVALGAGYEAGATPGFVEGGGIEIWSVEGAERAREELASFASGTLVLSVLAVPFKCPPAPYEAAFMLHESFVRRGVRDAIRMVFTTPMPMPIPVSEDASTALQDALTEHGIEHTHGAPVKRVDARARVLELAGGTRISYDLLLGVPRHRVPRVVRDSGLTEGGTDGWIAVDARNLRTPHDNVWALGDCADAPVPRAGSIAEGAARTVAADIASVVRGTPPPSPFPGRGVCFIEWGDGRVARVNADFLGPGGPKAPFDAPSAEHLREKAEWARERRARWFGR